jgi:chromosome segregation protein
MYLKNLSVLGFKSFADKTSLNFLPGITAIVGPNGCGKSNVADAVRWVLGEQSAKALRGGEMADVIFNGTDSRKPMSMAEVSLTIGDVDSEHLKAAGVELSYNEVTLTRRIFRDGCSEYFLNRTPCRLKDIQQLFMGTGVGRASYSIMAQGNITQILSSKPEDRRMVFEEAAGITRYKAQKREALRKLEYTEQNLVRVADLIREVKRQIGSLQRQAGKARRYKQLMLELQHLDTQLARHHFDVLQTELRERQDAVDRLRTEMEACSADVLRAENEIAQLRAQLSELEQQIGESQQHGMELKSQIDRHDARVHFNRERLRELESQNSKALNDIAQAEERRSAAEQELAVVRSKLTASTAALEQHVLNLQAKRNALHKVERELQTQQEALRQAQAAAFDAAQQLSRARNEINALDLQKQGNVVRLEKLSAEKIQLEEERSRLEKRLEEFAAHVEAEKQDVQARRGSVEERQKRLKELHQELAQAAQELDALVQQQAGKRSRLNVLEQLQAEHEGFSAGTLAALKSSAHVLGSLADRIRVPDEYIPAIEAALGHHLQAVLTEQPDAAEQILAELRAKKQGRASIAPLALKRGAGSLPASPVNAAPDASSRAGAVDPGVLPSAEAHQGKVLVPARGQVAGATPAMTVVEAEESVRALLESLLGETFVVPDLPAASASWQQNEGRCDFVTLNGELLTHHGVYTGGSNNGHGHGKTPASILGRKNQIAELRGQLAQLTERVNDASRGRGALQSEQTALEAGLQQAQRELRTQEVAIATHEGEFNALKNSLRVLHQKIDTVVYEIQGLAAQEAEGLRRREALAGRLGELEQHDRQVQQQLTELNEGLEQLRQQRDAAHAALTEAKVALATEEQLCQSFQHQVKPLEGRLRELDQLVLARRGEIGAILDRKAQFETEIVESEQQRERLQHEREVVNRQTAALLSQKSELEGEISSREDVLRELRRRLSELQQQRGALEVELAQKHMAVQNLRERIQQKYQLVLDDIRSECITITYADQGPARVQTLTPGEMAASGASTDWNAVAEQVAALQKRIDEMGPVNLVAIEEYEETEQRYQFLAKQHDDLTQAKTQLLEVINKINVQTRQMFTETFEKIRENFRNLFHEVFGGGKADLVLVDDGDVLECGIDIVARPPGKQLQSISLLSGGEQTMVAVSLLFAIYQVRPSPFCVLDELDAALDEANITRFVRVLQRFLSHSQFVIITHNKRTIGMADVLYGVTMQEQGVSKILSVKFHKVDEQVLDHTPAPLVPPPSAPLEEEEDRPMAVAQALELTAAT